MTEKEFDGALQRLSALGADLLLEDVHNRLNRMSRDGSPERAARELEQWTELLGPRAEGLTDRLLAYATEPAFQEALTAFRHRQRIRLDLFARVDRAVSRGAHRAARRLAPLLQSYLADLDQVLAHWEASRTVERRLAELPASDAVMRRHPTLHARWTALRKTLAAGSPSGPDALLDGLARIEHLHAHARAVEDRDRALQEAFDAVMSGLQGVDSAEIDAGPAGWPVEKRLKALEKCLQKLEAQGEARAASAAFGDLARRLSSRGPC